MSEDTKTTPIVESEAVEQEVVTDVPEDSKVEEKKVEITPEIQKVIDGAIESRIKREREKAQKEYEEKERLAKLSEEERKVELQKQYETELNKRETELKVAENKLAFTRKFETDNIPTEMLDYIVDEDEQLMQERYDKLKATWQTTLNKKLEERVKPQTSMQNFSVNSQTKQGLKSAY
jgi:hypothetical protein